MAGRIPSTNLEDLLSNNNDRRLNSISGMSLISPDACKSLPMENGAYTYYAPATVLDSQFYRPTEHNSREYPYLLINGQMNVDAFGDQAGAPYSVGKAVVEFVYEFVHTTQLYETAKPIGGTMAQDFAIGKISRLAVATENPAHGALVPSVGSLVGHAIDFAAPLFGFL
jgi:hypothetical protein